MDGQLVEPDKTLQTSSPMSVPDGTGLPADVCQKVLADWRLFPQVLNIQEASWLTQIPVKTFYKWNSEGKLKGVARRIGKQLRFDRDALLRIWVNGKKTAK